MEPNPAQSHADLRQHDSMNDPAARDGSVISPWDYICAVSAIAAAVWHGSITGMPIASSTAAR